MSTTRVKQRLQAILKQRGVRGLIGLQQAFQEFDLDKNGNLSWEEFNFALQKCGLAPSPQDARSLFLEFDSDGSNEISYREFIYQLRGELSARRRNIITRIFEGIDSDGDGIISMTDIGGCFNPKNHPDVRSGKTTVPILLHDFFETFNTVTTNGYVSLEQFLEYYANAAFFEDDATFESTMSSVWNISRRAPPTGGKSQSLQHIASARSADSASIQGDMSEQTALAELKAQLHARGARGIIGLSRKFRIMDDDGSKSLSLSEFKKGIRECSLKLSELELNELFSHFDRDRSGSVDYEEFLAGLRGNMSHRRKTLVGMAFSKMDKTGDGIIDPEDVIDTYDASKHPDVLAGKKTSDEVLREFLDTFDVGGEKDGKVTRNEFMNYYANVSSSIDDDDYFELMIRNAWHISGGEGWSANSANRRVLVTHRDGRQTVEEIKDDLGLKADDKNGMIARLKAQGIDAANISIHDGIEDKSPGQIRPSTASILERYKSAAGAAEAPQNRRSLGAQPSSLVAEAMGGLSLMSSSAPPSRPNTAPVSVRSAPTAGLQMIIAKLKQQLKSRGGNGFISLQRKFRIMDDDGSKSLNMAEFKKAMKEMTLGLSDPEMRMLFDHFDADRSGSIDFEEFIQGVRDPLNERRLRLVHMAFSRLDKDGSGLVDAADIASCYDASKHPDVLSGKKAPREVLEEFLDTFDVGEEKDGKVTRNEFENYYTNIGANIDNDDYFELMIRNAWHISGGEGWSANSANRRVLVTDRDGRESVQEIKDDLGLKAGDNAAAIARLRKQGVMASSISFSDGTEEKQQTPPKKVKPIFSLRDASTKQHNEPASSFESRREEPTALSPEVQVALQGPVREPTAVSSKYDPPSTFSKHSNSSGLVSSTPNYGLQMIIKRIKDEMKSRGAHGFIGMQRKFRIMDDDGSKALSMSEFKKAMMEMKINITEREMRQLFDHFDQDQSGAIDFEEFLQGVRDPLNERRRRLVNMAFSKLDKQNDGCVEPQDIVDMYDAKCHPDVISGKSTETEILQEFLDTFDVGEEKDGKVTRKEFENYYTNIGANIDNDDYFELMIRNAWHISGGEGWSANSANRRVLVTHADGRESVEEIRDDLGLKADDKAGITARLRAQGVHASSVELFNQSDNFDGEVKNKAKKFFQVRSGTTTAPVGVLPGTGAPAFSKKFVGSPKQKKSRSTDISNCPVAVQTIIKKIKSEMKSRGAHGFVGMQRRFRSMDDDGSKSLDMAEFRKAMKEMNMGLQEADLRNLFVHFDTDQSGTISFEEFIQGVRDPLSERRLALVHMAFKKLDKDRSGIVDAADIAHSFDASKHPEVIAGRMTPEQVFRQFLDTFDVGGQVDGKVTREEFENYYTNIGANIDSDDYFELMIRNAWHISGGEGWSANSANRRVLVTDRDGRESVQEIKDDLGLKAGDTAGMSSRLRGQGVDAHNVSTYGSVEDIDKKDSKHHAPVNLGHLAKTKKADPGRYGSTAGASTRAQPGLIEETLQLRRSDDRPGTRRPVARAEMDYGLSNIIRQLKAEMKSRGAHGFVGLQRKFRIMDDDGSKSLSMSEFKKAMKEMRLAISDAEMRMLFEHFDADRNGTINFEEFIQGVRDPLSDRRRQLVHLAFDQMDKDGTGLLDGTDLIDTYDASLHPDVIAGKKSAHDVLEEFLDTFDVGGVKDGKVTREEFENYYTNIGANIDNDDYFELMIRNAWHISGGEGWSENSANRRVLVTDRDGRESVQEIKDDLGLKAGDKVGMIAKLRKQGVQASSINLYGNYEDPRYAAADSQRPSTFRELVEHGRAGKTSAQVAMDRPYGKKKSTNSRIFESSIKIGDDGGSDIQRPKLKGGIARTHAAYDSNMSGAGITVADTRGERKAPVHVPSASSLATVALKKNRDVATLLSELRSELAKRGARGIVGLSRKFRIMDDNGNGTLSYAEFKKGVRECSLELSEQDYRLLFAHFDKDGSGDVDFEELLHGIRGEMNERRKTLVGMAFSKMDKTGDGIIDPEDVIDTYDASKHPDVLAGKKTSDEVLREFLDTFDVGGEKDGKVTRNEFMNYYANVSSSIDDDDYFELMIRNAWHISGGEGWSANSANRRVLVTHRDGRQTVEEIKDDLGLKADDKNGMIARLKAQGLHAADISLHDGMESKSHIKGPSPTYRSSFTIA